MEIGKLKANEGTKYVTWKEAKTQIRALAKAANLEIETFRPRSVDKNVLQVKLKDGSGIITAQRKPDSLVTVVKEMSKDEIPADLLAEIEAQSKWTPDSL